MVRKSHDCDRQGHVFFTTFGGDRVCQVCSHTIKAELGKTYAQKNHPETSHEAADLAVSQAAQDAAVCLDLINWSLGYGMICDEIAEVFESGGRIMPPNQVSSRVHELYEKGLVVRKGVKRKTRRDRNADVWVSKERV
jgi:hypothetical protein